MGRRQDAPGSPENDDRPAGRGKTPARKRSAGSGARGKGRRKPGPPVELDPAAKRRLTGGRPRFYETADELDAECAAYFADCETSGTPPGVAGLALWLGFSSRQALDNYSRYGPAFHDVVKRAKLAVEASYEQNLRDPRPVGSIFALKAMHGWQDVQHVQLTGSLARINMDLLPDSLIERIARGEHPAAVLAAHLARTGEKIDKYLAPSSTPAGQADGPITDTTATPIDGPEGA